MRPNIQKICFFPDIQYQSRPLTRQKFAFLLEVGFINRRRIWVSCQGRSWVCKIIDSRHLQEACCSWKKDGGNRRCITRGSICSFYSRIYEEWVRFYDTLCCVSVFFPVVKIRCLSFSKIWCTQRTHQPIEVFCFETRQNSWWRVSQALQKVMVTSLGKLPISSFVCCLVGVWK